MVWLMNTYINTPGEYYPLYAGKNNYCHFSLAIPLIPFSLDYLICNVSIAKSCGEIT